MSKTPVIAIIGRPNVGKSTLVNRIVGSRKAIVDDLPGVTRDRSYYDAEWLGRRFKLVDTGGLVPDSTPVTSKQAVAAGSQRTGIRTESNVLDAHLNASETDNRFASLINEQVFVALEEADAVIFVVDGQAGLMSEDEEVAQVIRKRGRNSGKPVFLAVNKIDQPSQAMLVHEFHSMGLGEPIPMSAMHGNVGVGNLLEKVFRDIQTPEPDEVDGTIKLCIMGRPNVGKSSMLNAIIGEDRTIVSEVSGTTRDAINVQFDYDGQRFEIIDTAGIRKKAKVDYGVEMFSVDRALRALSDSDVVVMVMDATENFDNSVKEFITDQDKKMIETVVNEGRALVITVNKWDLIPNKTSNTIEEFKNRLYVDCPHARFAPILFTSAKTGQRLPKVLEIARNVHGNWSRRHKTSLVNQILLEAVMLSPPHRVKGNQLRVYYATQVSAAPPTFILFVNDAKLLKDDYKRYLEKKLRENFELSGTPVILVPRNKNEKR